MAIGSLSPKAAQTFNLTGILLRSTGVNHDVRLNRAETYANYPFIFLKSYISYNGDCFDRYLLRIAEMYESLNIINQIIAKLYRKNHTRAT